MDIIESKVFKPAISKAKRKVPMKIYNISFLNKGVKLINVPHIFHDPSVKACLPTDTKLMNLLLYTRLLIQSDPNYLILINLCVI